jgi:hypothetical protein
MAEESDQNKEKGASDAVRKAIIGLVGTLLTVCCGLTGALISAGVTIYQVEREAQQVALPAPGSDQTLTIDTRQIAIDPDEAARLISDDYVVDTDLGFAMARPRAGWNQMEETTYYDLIFDETAISPLVYFFNLAGDTWDNQPLRRIRYAAPVEIQYQETSTENGIPVNLETLRSLTGDDTLTVYSQITLLVIDKQVAADITLATIALTWGPDRLYGGGVNRIVANRESPCILMQATSQLENVRVNGQKTELSIERWALFAEGPQHYYVVELNHIPAPGQGLQAWEDLQAYLGAFRVIQ